MLAVALLVPAGASAQNYPAPKDPGKVQPKPKGPHKTYTVCHKKRACDFRTIQKAVNKARAGDTVRVRNGVYREAVTISGKKKRYLRLVGNPKHPRKVVLRAKGKMQNAFFVNEADGVKLDGFFARNYKSKGFFFTNVNGWGSPLGFSGTNMRYVTITKSRFYNNAIGIVPDSEDGEKFPPPEKNVIIDNDIFWNNFDYLYDGNGTNNCWSMDGVTTTFPADRSTYAGCGATNAFSKSVQDQMLTWIGEGALASWNKHPHPAKPGFTPLEVFK